MQELEQCLKIRRDINDIENKLAVLRAAIESPKNQIMTGMPRGGVQENPLDKYLIKAEQLEKQKCELITQQKHLWTTARKKLKNISSEELYIMRLRFVDGLTWKKCVAVMNCKYGNWNINRAFRVLRKYNNFQKKY